MKGPLILSYFKVVRHVMLKYKKHSITTRLAWVIAASLLFMPKNLSGFEIFFKLRSNNVVVDSSSIKDFAFYFGPCGLSNNKPGVSGHKITGRAQCKFINAINYVHLQNIYNDEMLISLFIVYQNDTMIIDDISFRGNSTDFRECKCISFKKGYSVYSNSTEIWDDFEQVQRIQIDTNSYFLISPKDLLFKQNKEESILLCSINYYEYTNLFPTTYYSSAFVSSDSIFLKSTIHFRLTLSNKEVIDDARVFGMLNRLVSQQLYLKEKETYTFFYSHFGISEKLKIKFNNIKIEY